MRRAIILLLILASEAALAVNEHKAWKGAVEPDDTGSASANIHEAWKGAVEPTETAAGGATLLPYLPAIILQR